MNANEIKNMLDRYNSGDTNRSFVMGAPMHYQNEYIRVVRLDSSNKWIGYDDMSKMWSVIFDKRKSFVHLRNYQELRRVIDVEVTPVTRGSIKGFYGLRIRGMKNNPSEEIVRVILDYIFEE